MKKWIALGMVFCLLTVYFPAMAVETGSVSPFGTAADSGGISTIAQAYAAGSESLFSTGDEENGSLLSSLFDNDLLQKLLEAVEALLQSLREEKTETNPYVWYAHNTVCVAGLEFRDFNPGLTRKWYNFVPLDLSEDGQQVFDLVASNVYIVGSVIVDHTGDEVTVRWEVNKKGTVDANFVSEGEYLAVYRNIDEITSLEPEEAESAFAFNVPFSISKDLGGDTIVLLYVRNVATYCNNLSYKYQNPIYHERFWPNSSHRTEEKEALIALMNSDQVTEAAP